MNHLLCLASPRRNPRPPPPTDSTVLSRVVRTSASVCARVVEHMGERELLRRSLQRSPRSPNHHRTLKDAWFYLVTGYPLYKSVVWWYYRTYPCLEEAAACGLPAPLPASVEQPNNSCNSQQKTEVHIIIYKFCLCSRMPAAFDASFIPSAHHVCTSTIRYREARCV
jgi:hypothetical protein